MTMTRTLVAIGVTAIFAAACGEEAPPPAAAVAAKPKAAPVVAAGVADGGSEAEANSYIYNYNPVGKRDPFRSPLGDPQKKKEEGTPGEDPGCQEPLCAFDLEQLTLVAVVSGDANPIAMLEDPNRVGHIVRRNTRAGKQGGKVTQILRDCIVITEYFLGADGKKNPNRVNICVKKEAAQAPTIDLLINKAVE